MSNQFELDVEACLGDWIRESDKNAIEFWSALANVDWYNLSTKEEAGYSFRSAGGLIADIRKDGSDYMTWYCSGPYASVSYHIERTMKKAGWLYDDTPGVCDEPNCLGEVSCGWPSEAGYRQTCGEHYFGKLHIGPKND